jgi:hypothetical protein
MKNRLKLFDKNHFDFDIDSLPEEEKIIFYEKNNIEIELFS